MKITSVKCHLLTMDLAQGAFTALNTSLRYWTTALAEVVTDEGISGLGECYAGLCAPEATRALIETFAPLLVGENPFEIDALEQKMRTKSRFWAKAGLPLAVIGTLENALWDIRGKAAGEPVWKLLGGKDPQPIPVYASGGLEADEQGLVRELEGYLDQGYRAVKIRIWGSLEGDLAKARLARKVLGDDVDLMVDAVMGHNPRPWSGEEALLRAKGLEEINPVFFEEPCGNRDYEGYAYVRANSSVQIAGGESAVGLHEFKSFFDAGALDWVQPDPSHSGGILEARRIAALGRSYRVKTVFHSWGTAPCLLANYHLAFAEPDIRYLEFPTHGLPLVEELAIEPFQLVDGCFAPPQTPGLGVHLPEEVQKKYPFQPGTGFWP